MSNGGNIIPGSACDDGEHNILYRMDNQMTLVQKKDK